MFAIVRKRDQRELWKNKKLKENIIQRGPCFGKHFVEAKCENGLLGLPH